MNADVAVPILAVSIPIFVVPAILLFRHLDRKRELEHRERMAAIERGIEFGRVPSMFWPSMAALGMGAIVPLAALLFAFVTSRGGRSDDDIWGMSICLGVAGIIGGSFVGVKMLGIGRESDRAAAQDVGKPSFDPDAYDTVGTRG